MSEILLSFCIPVMNRLVDLQATLRRNLDDNRVQRNRVEFIVMCFDRGTETADWIQQNFAEELASGYLRFYQSDRLRKWHFGQAKNSFRGIAQGRIYASLDGDNFTGPAGGQHIIDVFEANSYNCIFHQFQGDWGDGTCGRVSMTMQDYEEIGYDENFLPRQWDELDAILSILVHYPTRQYIYYQDKSIAKKSGPFARFLTENAVKMATVEIDGNLDPLFTKNGGCSVGQNESSYVQDDKLLKFSSIFNHLSSFFKNTHNDELRNQYVVELVDVQRTMAERLDTSLLFDWFLTSQRTDSLQLKTDDIPLVACVRNEVYLDGWLDHYRRLGVTHFLLVDDDSSDPISERISAGDVWVWKPVCGKFRYSKAFWLELLLRRYAQGCWVITADSDEYLELPETTVLEKTISDQQVTTLQQLTDWACNHDIRCFAGFLLDMVPGPESLPAMRANDPLENKDFDRFQCRPIAPGPVYLRHNTVKWSYGESADWAYRIDIRFRMNRAFDSLRKFPIFQMDTDVHLNQGFHDLIISGEKRTASEMSRSDLLVIRHYNLLNAHYNSNNPIARPADAYHYETKINIERLQKHLVRAMKNAVMCPFTYPFLGHQLVPVPCQGQVNIRLTESKDLQFSFETALNRTADIPLIITDTAPQYRGGAIKARSMAEAAQWVAHISPFKVMVRCGTSLATLQVDEETEKSSENSSSWLSSSRLKRGFA